MHIEHLKSYRIPVSVGGGGGGIDIEIYGIVFVYTSSLSKKTESSCLCGHVFRRFSGSTKQWR